LGAFGEPLGSLWEALGSLWAHFGRLCEIIWETLGSEGVKTYRRAPKGTIFESHFGEPSKGEILNFRQGFSLKVTK